MTSSLVEALKMFYVQTIKGYDLDKIAAVTIVFEGTRVEVENQKASIFKIAAKH
jgi:hypothetical protein